MKKIKLGYVPTRRSIFSAPDAIKYRGLTADRLTELGIDFVDITDINEEGLLYDDRDVEKIAEKFEKEGVDGLMLAHCNFRVCLCKTGKTARTSGTALGTVGRAPGTKRGASSRYAVRFVRDRKGAAAIPGAVYILDELSLKRSGL